MKWKVSRVKVQTDSDEDHLREYLTKGWEPFAVTSTNYGAYIYHLRKRFYED